METDPKPPYTSMFPLPEGVKLRARKFGKNPFSAFVPAPVGGDMAAAESRPPFQINWEDQQQGLSVLVRERTDGHLIADVFCTDASLHNKAAVSVFLAGNVDNNLIGKTIPLAAHAKSDQQEKSGCSGSADFGPLTAAVKELGPQLGLIVFLNVLPGCTGLESS